MCAGDQRRRYLEDREEAIRRVQRWRKENPEKYQAWLKRNREERREARAAIDREGHLRRKYGMTIADYEFLRVAQHDRCAICNRKDEKGLHVDHEHRTGIVRGLLCGSL